MKGYHKIIDKYNKNQLIEMVEYIIELLFTPKS